MAKKVQVGIIGLGKFGLALGKALVDLGHEVLGLDDSEDKVKKAHTILTSVYRADATNKATLEQLGMAELDHVVISVGGSMESSLLIALYFKELGLENLWVKAINEDHEKLLRMLGVEHVVIPERYAAQLLAKIFD